MVAFSTFASVTITRVGMFTELSEGLEFIARLLKGFMIGFAIAPGVSFLILPITSRGNVSHGIKDYIASVEGVLLSQILFAEGDTVIGLFTGKGLFRQARTAMSIWGMQNESETDLQSMQNQIKTSITKLGWLQGKQHADLLYSKDEMAWASCQPRTSTPSSRYSGVSFCLSRECPCCQRFWRA